MDGRIALCVFAKPPVAGQAKTRLAAAVGEEDAARLAGAFLQDTWDAIRSLEWAQPVLATTEAFPELNLPGAETWLQGAGDLGERLERILKRALADGRPAIAIGADTPGLPEGILREARDALMDADAVVGPATDGGFYLLGLKRCPEGLFRDLPWSAANTLDAMLSRLAAAGLSVRMLPSWSDVDRPEDLAQLRTLIAEGRIAVPRTAQVLAALGLYPHPNPLPPAGEGKVSVIIPTLNEESRIGLRLGELSRFQGLAEVIVVDGGSEDRTLTIARAFPGVKVLSARKGRAFQMNAGAKLATGEILLFLHADVALPEDAGRWIQRTLSGSEVVAGAFRTWTVPDVEGSSPAPWLHLADFRSRYSDLPYGDQALFVRASAFRKVGGFPRIPLMEDLELSRRLRRIGKIRTVPARVRVSGRRFLQRPVVDTLLVNVFPLLYRLGVAPERLAKLYREVR